MQPTNLYVPYSYTPAAPTVRRSSVLGPLRKRQYQTKQQQIRYGTVTAIGASPRQRDEHPLTGQYIGYEACPRPDQHGSSVSDASSKLPCTAYSSLPLSALSYAISSSSSEAPRPFSSSSSSSFSTTNCSAAASLLPRSSSCRPVSNPYPRQQQQHQEHPQEQQQQQQQQHLQQQQQTNINRHARSSTVATKSNRLMGQAMDRGGSAMQSCYVNSSISSSSTSYSLALNSTISSPTPGESSLGPRRMSSPSLSTVYKMDGMRSSSSLSTSSPSTMYVSSTTAASSSVRSVSTLSCSSKSVNNNSDGESASSSFEYGRLSPVHVAELASQRLPLILREREVLLENYDKVFAMSWLSDEEILLGTKCNNIILFNTRTDKRVVVGQLADGLTWTTEEVQKHLKEQDHLGFKKPIGASSSIRGYKNETSNSRPLSYASIFSRASAHVSLRAFNAGRRSSTPSGFGSNDLANNLSSLAIRPQTSNIVQYGSSIGNNATASRGTVQEQPTWSYAQYSINRHTGGIRSIVVNPSGTMVAIGAGEPYYVTVYSLPEFEPIGLMHGHTDLVFSIKWVSDTVLASASRDGSLRIWSLKSEPVTQIPSFLRPINVWKATTTRSEANVRVRDLAYNRRSGQLMTLNTDGYVKLWDRESYNHLSKIKLTHYIEAVCLAANPYANLYAVGSQAHISILDPRTANTVHVIDSCDEGWGVRALEFKSHIITTGGGYGRLSFYDLRAQRYLDGFVHGPSNKKYLEIGEGWLDRDTAIAGGMAGFPIRNAVYAMQYDDTGTRLFAAGGPLQLDLSGSYAALWS